LVLATKKSKGKKQILEERQRYKDNTSKITRLLILY